MISESNLFHQKDQIDINIQKMIKKTNNRVSAMQGFKLNYKITQLKQCDAIIRINIRSTRQNKTVQTQILQRSLYITRTGSAQWMK